MAAVAERDGMAARVEGGRIDDERDAVRSAAAADGRVAVAAGVAGAVAKRCPSTLAVVAGRFAAWAACNLIDGSDYRLLCNVAVGQVRGMKRKTRHPHPTSCLVWCRKPLSGHKGK